MPRIKHPAKYTNTILSELKRITTGGIILDPFAGTGKIHELNSDITVPRHTIGIEIEPEWAHQHSQTIVGSALSLPFLDNCFDGVVTSCTYGNRLADSHDARDGSLRHSYKHTLGRNLHPENSGQLHWGIAYREFHIKAWKEVFRVCKLNGQFLLNIKDHYRNKQLQHVSEWHKTTILGLGFECVQELQVNVPSLKYGKNLTRVNFEWIYEFRKIGV